ncbi:sugar phosphate nucleotidyltransferase [Actinoplanes sp. NPDC051633]|uniref:nucleotidyltransferase family protein n=1 Tax=Actinoplanes sp. NPDC051633 TaxID=3155670 RepID=UPI0034397E61
MKAVVLAGGRGTRLAPYTFVLPKPLLPIGDQPIVERIVRRLALAGFSDIHISLGYLGGLISSYLRELQGLPESLSLSFASESVPLGTAGPLQSVPGGPQPLLVTNGDVLSDLDYADLVAYHQGASAALTIATQPRESAADFGVVTIDSDNCVTSFIEKPVTRQIVNMGIYVYEPSALAYLRAGERMDVPELVRTLLRAGERVAAYPFTGAWHDVGTPPEFHSAAREFG